KPRVIRGFCRNRRSAARLLQPAVSKPISMRVCLVATTAPPRAPCNKPTKIVGSIRQLEHRPSRRSARATENPTLASDLESEHRRSVFHRRRKQKGRREAGPKV